MSEPLVFTDRQEFRLWLEENVNSDAGVWLLFGKRGGPVTIKAVEALEEALCFGWIDGVMKSIDALSYTKYFSPRRAGSKWSEKNKKLVAALEERGTMTDRGRAAIAQAHENGEWDAPKPNAVTHEQIDAVIEILDGSEPALTNFCSMSPSVQKTYTRAYYDAKTEAGKTNRLAWMINRLNQNLKPM